MESSININFDIEYMVVQADPVTKDFSVFTLHEWNHIAGMLHGLDMKKQQYNDLSDAAFAALPKYMRDAVYFYLSVMQNQNGFVGFQMLCAEKMLGVDILQNVYECAQHEDVRVNSFRSCIARSYRDLVLAYEKVYL